MQKPDDFSKGTSDMTEMQSKMTTFDNKTIEMQPELDADGDDENKKSTPIKGGAPAKIIANKKEINWLLWGGVIGLIVIGGTIGIAIYKNKQRG